MIEKTGSIDGKTGLAFRASGSSMSPAIRKGDLLTVLPAEALQPGDMVVFRQGGELLCHRIARIGADGTLVTRGDAVAGNDPQVAAADVVGKVVRVRCGSFLPWRAPAVRILGWLRGGRFGRGLVALILPRLCRWYLAVPAPVQSLEVYAFHELSRPPAARPPGTLLVARLFGRTAARYSPGEDRAEAHAALSGLGLEEHSRRLWRETVNR